MTTANTDQLRAVLTHIVEDGDVWALLPDSIREAAMAQYIRLEAEDREMIKPAFITLIGSQGQETRMHTPEEAASGISVDFPIVTAWRAYFADGSIIGEWPVTASEGDKVTPPTQLRFTSN